MTENREYKEHLAFTLRELSHRTKNLLAVVQGLAHMIARRSDDIEDFEARFRGCIQALAYRTTSWCSTTGRARRWRNCCGSSSRRSAGSTAAGSWSQGRRSICARRRCSRSG